MFNIFNLNVNFYKKIDKNMLINFSQEEKSIDLDVCK